MHVYTYGLDSVTTDNMYHYTIIEFWRATKQRSYIVLAHQVNVHVRISTAVKIPLFEWLELPRDEVKRVG